MQAVRNVRDEETRSTSTPAPFSPSLAPPPAVLITLGTAVCAGLAGVMAPGLMGWLAIIGVALGGAYFTSRMAGPRPGAADMTRARRMLLLVERGGSAEPRTPSEFTEEWKDLYEKVNRLVFESKSKPAANTQVEQLKKQVELAAALMHDGKDPLVESPELRASALLPLLEGMKNTASVPVVSQLRLGEEEELIGAGHDALPPDWPMPSRADVTALENGLHELIGEIESLRGTLSGASNGATPASDDAALRTPAQLVDAVVLTAADGIEDLAAGLMRANELASVAERVTNRATLLALNAALEATRSGSEAFAAIAEETRRLAEFAREATDTIARLSSEIEYKVGETITAIHATSEDAKTSLAQLGGSAAVPVTSSARNARVQVVRLLDRSRQLLNTLGVQGEAPARAREAVSFRGTTPEMPESEQDIVENAPPEADKSPTEGMLLIEGLKPGANLES